MKFLTVDKMKLVLGVVVGFGEYFLAESAHVIGWALLLVLGAMMMGKMADIPETQVSELIDNNVGLILSFAILLYSARCFIGWEIIRASRIEDKIVEKSVNLLTEGEKRAI